MYLFTCKQASAKQQRWGASILGLDGREGHHRDRVFKEIYESARRLSQKQMYLDVLQPGPKHKMATTDLNHFLSIPWCAKLLNDPSVAFLHTHDKFQDSIRNQGLFADGVSSLKDGVRAQLAFYHRRPQQAVDPQAPFPELSVMFDLGNGVSGWPGISHGGFVSYIFDTVAGRLAMCNIDSPPEETVSPFTMTAKLDVNYRKPVRLDQVLIVTAVIEKIEGRKMHVGVKLEDESREVLSDGAALFLLTNVPRL